MSSEGRDKVIEQAEANGWAVVECEDDIVQVDIDIDKTKAVGQNPDKESILKGIREKLKKFKDLIGWKSARYTMSKSGGVHLYIKLCAPRPLEHRIILAMFLGSDPLRELLNLGDYLSDKTHIPFFVEVQKEAVEL